MLREPRTGNDSPGVYRVHGRWERAGGEVLEISGQGRCISQSSQLQIT